MKHSSLTQTPPISKSRTFGFVVGDILWLPDDDALIVMLGISLCKSIHVYAVSIMPATIYHQFTDVSNDGVFCRSWTSNLYFRPSKPRSDRCQGFVRKRFGEIDELLPLPVFNPSKVVCGKRGRSHLYVCGSQWATSDGQARFRWMCRIGSGTKASL